jgi:hypothetical protein|tara:strand:- start:1622 stop:1894 length:273 start_codon:yes stop_codon:yes gene_type:complete
MKNDQESEVITSGSITGETSMIYQLNHNTNGDYCLFDYRTGQWRGGGSWVPNVIITYKDASGRPHQPPRISSMEVARSYWKQLIAAGWTQ